MITLGFIAESGDKEIYPVPSFTEATNICPGSSDPYYIVTYNITWVTTLWTHSSTSLKQSVETLLIRTLNYNTAFPKCRLQAFI